MTPPATPASTDPRGAPPRAPAVAALVSPARRALAATALALTLASPAAAAPGDISLFAGGPAIGTATEIAITPSALTWSGGRLIAGTNSHSVLRAFDLTSGATSVLAGVGVNDGTWDDSGLLPLPDGSVPLQAIDALATAPDGTIYSGGAGVIKRIAPDGTVTTFAGIEGRRPTADELLDGRPASETGFNAITGLLVTDDGDLLVLEGGTTATSGRVRRIAAGTHVVTTLAGGGAAAQAGATGPASEAYLRLPSSLALAPDGDLLINERGERASGSRAYRSGNRVRRIDAGADGSLDGGDTITTIAGPVTDSTTNGAAGGVGDGGPATDAKLDVPHWVHALADGTILVGEAARVRRIAPDGTISTLVGGGTEPWAGAAPDAVNLTGLRTALVVGERLFLGGSYGVYETDVTAQAPLRLVAGNGRLSSGDEGSPAVGSQIVPAAVAVAPDGTTYISDYYGARLLRIDPGTSTLRRVYGDGTYCSDDCGVDGPARERAGQGSPDALTIDRHGRVYIVEGTGTRIRRIDATAPDPSQWTVTTIAGRGTSGSTGDGGPALDATLNDVVALTLSADERTLYLGERQNQQIRAIDLSTGVIDHYAGTLIGEGVPEGGDARNARFNSVNALATLPNGDLLVGENSFRMSRIDTQGRYWTYAQRSDESVPPGVPELGEPVVPLAAAKLGNTQALAVRADGTVAVTMGLSGGGSEIWLIEPGGPVVRRLAGPGSGLNWDGDSGPAWNHTVASNASVAFMPDGSLLSGSLFTARVQRIEAVAPQLRIDTVAPSALRAGGDPVQVRIGGGQTLGDVRVDAGAGVTVSDVRRDGPTAILATLRADAAAAAGPRDLAVTVTADGARAVKPAALTVEAAPEPTPIATPAQVTPPPSGDPAPAPTPAPVKPAAKRPTLRLGSAKLRARTLTLRTRLSTRSRVTITVLRRNRVVARAKARTVAASTRTLRVRVNRKLARGSYRVRVVAKAPSGSVTRTIALRVR